MPWSFENHDCSGDSTSCIYCLSDIQQAEQVEKIFKLSHHNPCNNEKRNRDHVETPPRITNRPSLTAIPVTIDSLSMGNISHYQFDEPDFQPIDSLSMGNISHYQFDEPDFQPIEQQILNSSNSLVETSKKSKKSSEFLSVDTVDEASSLKTGTSQVFVQIIIPQVVSNGVFVSNPSTISLPVNTLSICESRPSEQNSVQPFQSTNVLSDTSRINDSEFQVTKKPKSQVKCKCPNCNAVGGNKSRGPDGQLQHICHIPHCEKVFSIAQNLRIHLDWHAGKMKYTCALCNKGFNHKFHFKNHLRKHEKNKVRGSDNNRVHSSREDSRPLEITVQKNIENIRPQLACRIAGCGKIYFFQNFLTTHLKRDHGVKPHVCTWPSCNKAFDMMSSLKSHLNTHRNK